MKIIFKTDPRSQIAKDALDAGLYINGWQLKKELETIHYFDDRNWADLQIERYDIVVAYDYRGPVGVMVLTNLMFNTFVTPRHRRKGLGRSLYQKMMQTTKRNYLEVPMMPGIRGSRQFFRKLGHDNILELV